MTMPMDDASLSQASNEYRNSLRSYDDGEEQEGGDDSYSWSDASALYQLEHGEPGPRRASARAWLEARLAAGS